MTGAGADFWPLNAHWLLYSRSSICYIFMNTSKIFVLLSKDVHGDAVGEAMCEFLGEKFAAKQCLQSFGPMPQMGSEQGIA